MSRSGYTDDYDDDPLADGRWRAAVKSAIGGKRGQQTLREILAALDAMPEKALAAESLVTAEGEYCTLGVLGARRGIAHDKLDPEDAEAVAEAFGIAPAMVREIVFYNDEHVDEFEWVARPEGPPTLEQHLIDTRYSGWRLSDEIRRPVLDAPERRWKHMRAWVAKQIKDTP